MKISIERCRFRCKFYAFQCMEPTKGKRSLTRLSDILNEQKTRKENSHVRNARVGQESEGARMKHYKITLTVETERGYLPSKVVEQIRMATNTGHGIFIIDGKGVALQPTEKAQ